MNSILHKKRKKKFTKNNESLTQFCLDEKLVKNHMTYYQTKTQSKKMTLLKEKMTDNQNKTKNYALGAMIFVQFTQPLLRYFAQIKVKPSY